MEGGEKVKNDGKEGKNDGEIRKFRRKEVRIEKGGRVKGGKR
jgi:hypothetical protein